MEISQACRQKNADGEGQGPTYDIVKKTLMNKLTKASRDTWSPALLRGSSVLQTQMGYMPIKRQ